MAKCILVQKSRIILAPKQSMPARDKTKQNKKQICVWSFLSELPVWDICNYTFKKKKKAKKSIYEYFSYLFKTQPNFSECLTISTLNKTRFSMYINIYTNPPGVYRLSVYFTKWRRKRLPHQYRNGLMWKIQWTLWTF